LSPQRLQEPESVQNLSQRRERVMPKTDDAATVQVERAVFEVDVRAIHGSLLAEEVSAFMRSVRFTRCDRIFSLEVVDGSEVMVW
tara:strand:- start:915 stop:1169 length:255 start_codon:yes stop_codon:yes gene_type:complete